MTVGHAAPRVIGECIVKACSGHAGAQPDALEAAPTARIDALGKNTPQERLEKLLAAALLYCMMQHRKTTLRR